MGHGTLMLTLHNIALISRGDVAMSDVTKTIRRHRVSNLMLVVNNQDEHSSFWDEDFIKKHDVSGPRYTSYPTALQFHEEFTTADYEGAVIRSNQRRKPLSIYIHLPFCASLCYYCACNKVVTKNKDKMRHYLDLLISEIRQRAAGFCESKPVYQMHWGGGTPTYYDEAELTELMYVLGRSFHLVDRERADYSVEIDPRTVSRGKLGLLKGLGFNRLSFGIQDFDPDVQKAINREQPLSMVEALVQDVRAYGFKSLNFDLIYGLPYQTVDSYRQTVDKVLELAPDRLSVFNYAHLPERFKAQGQMPEEAMPSADEKLEIFCQTARQLTDAGYIYIGMDHFAKPDDELSLALKKGDLHRNFQGYTTHKDADLVGLGVSAISQIDNVYCQNTRSIRDYEKSLESGELPIQYGVILEKDDKIRRDIIMALICHYRLETESIERVYNIEFDRYFAKEMGILNDFAEEGLLAKRSYGYEVTPRGHLVIRKICMAFDRYLPDHLRSGRRFSRIL